MSLLFTIENLKCGGCANSITKSLSAIEQVKNVTVDVEKSQVMVDAASDMSNIIETALSKLGYPVVGAKNSIAHKAKSFVSCAIGRLDA